MEMKKREKSLFWPLTLVATGCIWLLVNLGIVAEANLWALLHFLPFALIAVGIGLIVQARWPVAGKAITILIVLCALLAVIFAPQLGWAVIPPWSMGANFSGAVAGSRAIVSEGRDVNGFDSVTIKYPAEVTIRQSGSESMSIEADDNLLPQLSTRVINGMLIVENNEPAWNKRVNPSQPVRISITVKDLHSADFSTAGSMNVADLKTDAFKLSVSGAGDVNLNAMEVSSLDCRLSGAGNIKANGMADKTTLHISGVGNYNGAELSGNDADVHISGAGSATLWLKSSLNAAISGAGSIKYYGNPAVSQHVSGAGTVQSLGNK
jgi:hypothetical protein